MVQRVVIVLSALWVWGMVWVGCASIGEPSGSPAGSSSEMAGEREGESAEARAAAERSISEASAALEGGDGAKAGVVGAHTGEGVTHDHAAHGLPLGASSMLPEHPEVIPTRPEGTQRLRFAVLSDMNGRYGSTTYGSSVNDAVLQIIALRPDVVLSAGDMIAGQKKGLNYNAMWRAFHATVTKQLTRAQIPFAVAPGNHDASGYPQYQQERRTYVKTWRENRPEKVSSAVQMVDAKNYPLNYAFRQGPALFIALDATTKGPLHPEQRAWLDHVLTTHGADAPVKIVFGHVPLFPFAQGHADNEYLGDRKLEAILVKHDVDLVISGHHHAYYPGTRHALRLAAVSCVGAGPRPLLGAPPESAQRSFLWVELDEHGLLSVDALAGPDYTQRVERQTLPEVVGLWPNWITRDDLTPAQAAAAIQRAEEATMPQLQLPSSEDVADNTPDNISAEPTSAEPTPQTP